MINIKLKEVLKARGWSQSKLALKSGIRPNTISDICNNKAKCVTLIHLDRICNSLKCDLTDIVEHNVDN